MKIEKFVFIIPNSTWFGKRFWGNFPYTLGLLNAILKKENYQVEVIDANIENLSEQELKERISEVNPDIVGISALALEYRHYVHRTFELVKEVNNEIITVLGGIYPTLSIDLASKDQNIDFIIRGEGEERIVSLLKTIEGDQDYQKVDGLAFRRAGESKFQINPFVKRITNLDSLPFPDYGDFDMEKYMNFGQKYSHSYQFRRFPVGQIMTTRGCPYRCGFCANNKIYGNQVIMRSAEDVLEEIDMLVKKYGIQELIIVDDNFLLSKPRAMAVMQGMIDRKYDLVWKPNALPIFLMDDELIEKMKESGCYQVTVSIESGSPNTLKRMKKPINLDNIQPAINKLKEMGIELISSFVIGFPGDTWEDIRECFSYVESIDIDYALFAIATPLPATELYDICLKENLLPPDFSFERSEYCGFGKGFITTDQFTPSELEFLRTFEWDRINFRTEEKKAKIARMVGCTMEELENWRMDTRRSVGVGVGVLGTRQEN